MSGAVANAERLFSTSPTGALYQLLLAERWPARQTVTGREKKKDEHEGRTTTPRRKTSPRRKMEEHSSHVVQLLVLDDHRAVAVLAEGVRLAINSRVVPGART